jgi:hypothetical protein
MLADLPRFRALEATEVGIVKSEYNVGGCCDAGSADKRTRVDYLRNAIRCAAIWRCESSRMSETETPPGRKTRYGGSRYLLPCLTAWQTR